MKNIIISEWKDSSLRRQYQDDETYELYLPDCEIKDCLGCWSCWIKTPGRCVQDDLTAFYFAFFQAEKAVFYITPVLDFISGNLKTLFDRFIVCALPYIVYDTGESRHVPRYEHMPEWIVYYKDEFSSSTAKTAFLNYFKTVAGHFSTTVKLYPHEVHS